METLLNEMADLVGITPWEIRYRNAIRPGEVLPNGQIVGPETGLVETLEAVKPYYDAAKYVGIGCAMKNAGVGVGLPDWGRCRLLIQDGKVHIHAGASCIGQGLGTVLVQICCDQLSLPREAVVYEHSTTYDAPDSGTTSGSRQTLITGEACRRACQDLKTGPGGADPGGRSTARSTGASTWPRRIPLGADVPNPVSHVAYGYATQLCVLGEDGRIQTHRGGPRRGQGGESRSPARARSRAAWSCPWASPSRSSTPWRTAGPPPSSAPWACCRADQVPEVKAIVVEKPGLDVACGAIGIGEITAIPTAPRHSRRLLPLRRQAAVHPPSGGHTLFQKEVISRGGDAAQQPSSPRHHDRNQRKNHDRHQRQRNQKIL